MKKIIAISLCIVTIVFCGWLILENIDNLDIPSNKNDQIAMWEKQRINKRTDIDLCEKQVLKKVIDLERKNKREQSNIAFQIQFVSFSVIVIQLILIVFIVRIPF